MLSNFKVMTDRELAGLKAYKYKATGYTILDDLHNPIWTCKGHADAAAGHDAPPRGPSLPTPHPIEMVFDR